MSYSSENRTIQTRDTSFPLLNSIGSSFVCGPCYFQHTYKVPTIVDFHRFPHHKSTRISQFWLNASGYWQFTNFKNETYLRSRNSPVWYYQSKRCIPGQMCAHHSMEVEMVYGIFLCFPYNTNWIYRGYLKDPNYYCLVWFSEGEYQRCCNIPSLPYIAEVVGTSDAHQKQAFTPSPPGFQQGHLMYFIETVENVPNLTRTGLSLENHDNRVFSTEQIPMSTLSSEINRNVGQGKFADTDSGSTNNCPNREIPVVISHIGCKNSLEKHDTNRVNSTVTNSTHNNLSTVTHHVESKPLDTVCDIYNESSINCCSVLNLHALNHIQASTYCKENGGSFAKHAQVNTLSLNPKESKPLTNVDSSNIEDQMANSSFKSQGLKAKQPQTETLSSSGESKLSLNNGESIKNESQKLINHSINEPPSNFISKPGNNSEIEVAGQTTHSRVKGDSSSSTKNCGLPIEGRNGLSAQQNVTDSEVQRTNEVFATLQSRFRGAYKRRFPTNEFPKGHEIQRTPDSLKYDLSIMFQENGAVKRDDKMFSRRKITTQEDILILGLAGFGKTTLCLLMSHHWAVGYKDIKDFGLCIVCRLPEVGSKTDINSFIVSLCNALLGNRNISAETVEKSLSKHSKEIVLLLDGYDQIPEDRQKDVLYFLSNRTVFQDSTVVVTSRPTSNAAFVKRFHRRVYIEGFRASYLKTVLGFIEVPDDSIKNFLCTVREQKLNYLKGLSPFFVLTAAEVVRKNYERVDIFSSLYVLLDHVIGYVVDKKKGMKESDYHKLDQFQLLGRMCFEKLVSGEEDFKEKEMVEAFGKDMDFLIECNIFYMVSGRKENVWRLSCKVLTVFFATMYLRTSWLEVKDREKFLQEVFAVVDVLLIT